MQKQFAADQLDIACNYDNQYVCGSQFSLAGHILNEAVYCNHSLTCSSLVEPNLCTANSSSLNKLADSFAVWLCTSCGIKHLAPGRSEQLGTILNVPDTPNSAASAAALSSWSTVMVPALRSRHMWMPRKSSGSPNFRISNMEPTRSTRASASAVVFAATKPSST
jgi:hypothetical protein